MLQGADWCCDRVPHYADRVADRLLDRSNRVSVPLPLRSPQTRQQHDCNASSTTELPVGHVVAQIYHNVFTGGLVQKAAD